jgi:hypothetical protein
MAATLKILYNDCYGGFHLSDAFKEEYERRTGKAIVAERVFASCRNTIRTDPVAIAIYMEQGAEWSSAPNSNIRLYEIPATFANYWSIDEYDGDETVSVNVESALADVLETYIQTGDHAKMLDQYRRIKSSQHQMMRAFTEALST